MKPEPKRKMRNRNAITTGRLDLADYDDVFHSNYKCGFTDVDAVIEKNGHVLIVEMKKPYERLLVGQRILYQALAGKEDITVIVRWGERGATDMVQVINYHKSPIKCTEGRFRAILAHWWDDALADRSFKPNDFFKKMTVDNNKGIRIRLPRPKNQV